MYATSSNGCSKSGTIQDISSFKFQAARETRHKPWKKKKVIVVMAYTSHLSRTQDDVDPAFGVNDVTDLAYLESICGVFKGLLHLPPAKGT